MRSVSAVVIAVVLAMLVAACGGGGSSSSSSSPSGQEVVADGGHQPGYVYKSATGKGGPQETAEVQAYVQETLGPGWEGECVSFEAEAPPGHDLFDCSYEDAGGKKFGSFFAVNIESGEIWELGLRGNPNPEGPYEYEHPLPGE